MHLNDLIYGESSEYADTDGTSQVVPRMSALAEDLGLDHFSFVFLKLPFDLAHKSSLDIYASYPTEWLNWYQSQGYTKADPVADLGRRKLRPFAWGGERFLSRFQKHQRQVFDEARDFGITHGVTIPLRGPQGEVSIFSLVSKNDANLSTALREAGARVLNAAYDTHKKVLEEVSRNKNCPALSPREKECLSWTLEGKTAGETATILGISVSTVNQHAHSASQKLGCLNKHHAAVQALRWNLI